MAAPFFQPDFALLRSSINRRPLWRNTEHQKWVPKILPTAHDQWIASIHFWIWECMFQGYRHLFLEVQVHFFGLWTFTFKCRKLKNGCQEFISNPFWKLYYFYQVWDLFPSIIALFQIFLVLGKNGLRIITVGGMLLFGVWFQIGTMIPRQLAVASAESEYRHLVDTPT